MLILEDLPDDAEFMVRALEAEGLSVTWWRVDTLEAFRERLASSLDVILADYRLRGFTGLDALRVARAVVPSVPCIMVTGELGDERAVRCLREGATDYVLKSAMARLGPAVRRALTERRLRQRHDAALAALRESERRMRSILSTVEDVVWSLSLPDDRVLYLNRAASTLTGRPLDELRETPGAWLEVVHPDDRSRLAAAKAAAVRWGVFEGEFRVVRPDHAVREVVARAWAAYGADGAPVRLEGILSDVTEVRRAERERQAAEEHRRERERLEQLDRFKSRYISMIAHELNNVVSPMTLYIDVFSEDRARDLTPIQRRSIAAFDRGLGRLEAFLADLLDASRLQAGRLELSPATFDVGVVVEQLVEDHRPRAEVLGVGLSVDATRTMLTADARRIEQVLLNLLGNALKFTPAGGEVHVEVRRSDAAVEVRVTDSGPGIGEEDRERVFEPFAKLGQETQGKHTGTGLGLFISRGIAEAHGGDIWCERAGPDGGARFVLRLPAAFTSSGPGAVTFGQEGSRAAGRGSA